MNSSDKEIKKLQRKLEKLGYEIIKKKDHTQAIHPADPGACVTLPRTGRDWRSMKNILSQIKRTFHNAPHPE